jgi:hypothetical protein
MYLPNILATNLEPKNIGSSIQVDIVLLFKTPSTKNQSKEVRRIKRKCQSIPRQRVAGPKPP